jgi:glutaminase
MLIDYQNILNAIAVEVEPLTREGRVADYIPSLARVPLGQFGMCAATLDGRYYSVGAADQRFSIQSISKLFTLTQAFRLLGDALWERVGREPSGNPFNSLVQLENEAGKPRNPFINAGALVITDILCSHSVNAPASILHFLRRLSGSADLQFDREVAASEAATGNRNAAMAHFMKSFGRIRSPVEVLLDSYFHQCSIAMSCRELATSALFLANRGVLPVSGEHLLTASEAKRISAVMLTCGTYDAAGDFAYRVGLPVKSGVGGGILAVVPGEMAVCVWSPGLDACGNSLAGGMALERFTTLAGNSVF